MPLSRRDFLGAVAAATALPNVPLHAAESVTHAHAPTQGRPSPAVPGDRFDPWIEVEPAAIRHNVGVLSRLGGGKPILAVAKNNAYGLGLSVAGPILDAIPEVSGLAVVKTSEALALREAGVRKPILLMALSADSDAPELLARDITFAACTDDALARLERASRAAGKAVPTVAIVDTGMNRIGIPYHRAEPWLARLAASNATTLRGAMTDLTEDREFDVEQMRRLRGVADAVAGGRRSVGPLHAASSDAVFNTPGTALDMIRPGISLYGAYPSNEGRERSIAALRPAVRLRARVVRVEQLRAGDSVSYGRSYVAKAPVWLATVPMGHVDGVPRAAVKGASILINGRAYPVIGAVSASHAIVEIGDRASVSVGDIATVIGPDDPAIDPHTLAIKGGISVYDVLMHLSPALPRYVV